MAEGRDILTRRDRRAAYRVGMIIDRSGAARRPPSDRVREWLAEQGVFISSAIGDTAAERRVVAAAVEAEGARAVWFEEFGRDADAEEAYMAEVDSATIYVGILKEAYGRLNPPDGFSATESEFLRARDGGKRLSVFIAAPDAPGREGHLSRFIDRVRFWITTENYASTDDLERRVVRRLHELAGEALSPWVKLGDLVFRADLIDGRGDQVTIRARVSEEIAHQLETALDQRFGTSRLRAVYRGRVGDAELTGVRHTTAASGADELTLELTRVQRVQSGMSRAGTGGRSPDDLVELGMRLLFLGEPLPDSLGMLGNMTDPGIDHNDLRRGQHEFETIAPDSDVSRRTLADRIRVLASV